MQRHAANISDTGFLFLSSDMQLGMKYIKAFGGGKLCEACSVMFARPFTVSTLLAYTTRPTPARCHKIKSQETSLLPLNSSPAPLHCHNTTVNTPPIFFSLTNGSFFFITLPSRNSIQTIVLCNHSNKSLDASHRLSNSPRNLNVPLFRCSHIPANGVQSVLNSPPPPASCLLRLLSHTEQKQCGSPKTPADC